MGNSLKNCGFVDGVAGWASLDGELSIDETNRGGPGRAVLALAFDASGPGEVAVIASTQVDVVGGRTIEAMGLFSARGATVEASVAIRTAGGALLARIPLPVRRPGVGEAVGGLPYTFTWAYAQVAAPAGGKASFELTATATAAGGVEVWLCKPYMDADWTARPHPVWDPGAHDNVDLQLPTWPTSLPPLHEDGFQPTPTPTRKGFDADSGIEISRRWAVTSWTKLQAAVNCDPVQRYRLERFNDEVDGPFWFVRPDTDQLCRARFTSDGDPKLAGQAPDRSMMSFSLLLQVA